MKHSGGGDDGVLQTNLLQAFQKNKVIQGQLNERHRLYYIQWMKNMQDHHLREDINKELLYAWKKENYIRQLKQNLQEYEKKRFGARDAYYEYQARNLDCIVSGTRALVIPPKEEERRLNVHTKYQQFLDEHPLRPRTATRTVQSVNNVSDLVKRQKEEDDAHAVQNTWKHIHAQSAVGLKRKQRKILPSIQRSSTIQEITRNKSLTKNLLPTTNVVVSNIPATAILEVISDSSEGKRQATLPVAPTHSTLAEEMAPIIMTSETLDKETRADLVAMRSVRRPQKNPIDLNLIFETRKRIYQINKHVYDHQLCPRKCGLQYNSQFDRPEQIDPIDDEENLLVEMSEITRRRYEDRHQIDKHFF